MFKALALASSKRVALPSRPPVSHAVAQANVNSGPRVEASPGVPSSTSSSSSSSSGTGGGGGGGGGGSGGTSTLGVSASVGVGSVHSNPTSSVGKSVASGTVNCIANTVPLPARAAAVENSGKTAATTTSSATRHVSTSPVTSSGTVRTAVTLVNFVSQASAGAAARAKYRTTIATG
ncbi:putative lysozyme-like protein [Schistocerca americana]|uniref:putative lysozyme-like protein n=1 Tax=Schistocerca americana TaxID=7009 RepID=UPI001F4F6DF4|nr:putative lysozyme-like protein [Schistocerca americana]